MSATAFSIFINSRFLRRNFQNADWRKRLRKFRIFFRAQFKKNWIGLKISENSKKHRKLARLAEPVDGETVDGTFRLDTR